MSFMSWMKKVFAASKTSRTGATADPSPVYSGTQGEEARAEPVLDALRNYLAGRARPPLVPEQIKPGVNLFDNGYVDSLTYVEFLAFVERRYGIAIPDHLLTGRLSTLADLASHISAHAAGSPGVATPQPTGKT